MLIEVFFAGAVGMLFGLAVRWWLNRDRAKVTMRAIREELAELEERLRK